MHPWVQKFYPVLGLGCGERLLWHFQTPVLYWINFGLRSRSPPLLGPLEKREESRHLKSQPSHSCLCAQHERASLLLLCPSESFSVVSCSRALCLKAHAKWHKVQETASCSFLCESLSKTLQRTATPYQKNPRVRNIFCLQFWGRKWLRQFYGRLEKCVRSAGKAMSIKFLVLGGGVIWVWGGGGGKCRLYFYGREDFSETLQRTATPLEGPTRKPRHATAFLARTPTHPSGSCIPLFMILF